MNKRRLQILGIFSSLCISFMVGILIGVNMLHLAAIPTGTVRWTAHTKTDTTKYELVSYDSDTDIGYYRPVDASVSDINFGSIVFDIYGEIGQVLFVTPAGFIVDASAMTVQAGDSGTPIFCENQVIGYVSSRVNNDLLYCIWK